MPDVVLSMQILWETEGVRLLRTDSGSFVLEQCIPWHTSVLLLRTRVEQSELAALSRAIAGAGCE